MTLYLVPIEPPDPDADPHHFPVTPIDLGHEGRTSYPHACPYQMVIVGNPGPHCHCCPVCVIECQDELW